MEKEYKILPKVTAILQDSELSSKNTNHKKLRVCAYARVSTEKEEQEYSFEKQQEYYIKYISNHSDWEFVGIYSDFGLSGKNKKRPQFMRMIEDCNCGKIDKIITKSISRFARNTIDCIQTVRDLREKGIGVYFEREGVDSLDSKSNLVLSIMAIVAEEESRSISNNIKWGIQKRFAKGHYLIHTKNFLGYSRENYDNIVIIPKQALTVRKIYQLCLDGKTLRQIVAELEMNGIETPCGNKKWRESTVLSILKNEKYKGDCLLQKTYTADFLSSKRCKNTGQLKSYYVKCHHAPIVSEQTFEKVQKELQWRRGLQMGTKVYPSKYSGKTFLSGLIICGQCGGIMRRHIQCRSYGGAGYWVCQRHDQGNCVMLQIKEKAIIESLQMVIRQILFEKENVYNEIVEIALNAIKMGKSVGLKKLNAKIRNTRNKLEKFKRDYTDGKITYEEYCDLSRPFIYAEPFMLLEKDEMCLEYNNIASIDERLEKIKMEIGVENLYENCNEQLLRYMIKEIKIITNKFAICRLINGSEYYMFLDTWIKGTKRTKV